MLLFFSLRILPHLQDTGGFFVAVLEKHDWLPWQLEAASSKKKSQTEQPPQTITKEEILNEEEETENVPVSVVTQSKRPDDILGRYSTFILIKGSTVSFVERLFKLCPLLGGSIIGGSTE